MFRLTKIFFFLFISVNIANASQICPQLVKYIIRGEENPNGFSNAIALNLPYDPIVNLRTKIQERIGVHLDFFKGWDTAGEAHVTVLTPPEIHILQRVIPKDQLDAMAADFPLQNADLRILGIGSASATLDGKTETTYYLVVESDHLRAFRDIVQKKYLAEGGSSKDFNATTFYPHITIGYTKRDLHVSDGVIKDEKTIDHRFNDLLPIIN